MFWIYEGSVGVVSFQSACSVYATPGILIVLVASVPVTVTPAPTKFIAYVVGDNWVPSSWTWIPPLIWISFSSPVPVTCTPNPLKWRILARPKFTPDVSSFTVTPISGLSVRSLYDPENNVGKLVKLL